ncbi:MAG: hypothetical protein ACK442_07690 [Novosphingobium sp.]|jgi:hypothetical protein|nr:hypothetical protein [Brevundimonas sp.]
MDFTESARLLVFSGSAAMFFSTLLGVAMLIPMQPWGRHLAKGLNYRQIGAAHLDWIMLGLMQALAAGLIVLFALNPATWVVWAMILGGWLNPLPYVFRAFGVDAFAMAGGPLQRFAAGLGAVSATLIVVSWAVLLHAAWQAWG